MTGDDRPATKQDLLDMKAEILRAIHDSASPIENRLRLPPMIDERLSLLEERVGRLERERLSRH